MSMFCFVIMLLLLYVHVCVTRTGWKTRSWPKTVILSIKKSNQINQIKYIGLPISDSRTVDRNVNDSECLPMISVSKGWVCLLYV